MGTPNTRTIYFPDSELWEQLRDAADRRNMSTSALIVEAVGTYIANDRLCPTCKAIRQLLDRPRD